MKSWFPFTDYDFYAYLTSGMIVLFSVDYGFNGGEIASQTEWSFIQIVFAIAMAYLVGHVVASFASVILEHWIARRVLRPPIAIMMNLGEPVFAERFIGKWIVGRNYEPMPESLRTVILTAVAMKLGKNVEEITNPEDVFHVAFPVARGVVDASTRMDGFRNLYGLLRNVTLAGMIAAAALLYRAAGEENSLYWWVFTITVLSAIMFGRFLKFYATYAAEILRTYASENKRERCEN